MDTKALRQKILDLAVRGKLVSQNPDDEPACILLERIRAEKQQMVKDGKLNAKDVKHDTVIFTGEDGLHYEKFADSTVKCIEDEIPFELPEGWAWARLPALSTKIFAGGDKPDICLKELNDKCSVPIYSNGIENEGLYGYTDIPRVTEPSITISARGTIGYCCIRNTPFVPIIRLITVVPSKEINIGYLKTVFETLIEVGEGSSIPQLTVPGIKPKLIPVPPKNQQDKIQKSVEAIAEHISSVDYAKEELTAIIKQAKSKILDLAIRGKLVPQDPDDEPASVLLERIRAEKEELIKQGKIKRDKTESIIFKGEDNAYYEKVGDKVEKIEDEIPFELPKGWAWCRLQNICSILTDGTHKTPQYNDEGYIFLSSKNVTSGLIDWNNAMFIPESLHQELYSRLKPQKGDILLAKNGTTGVAAIVDRDCVFDIYVSLALIRIVDNMINPLYVLYTIGSPYIQDYFNSSLKGIGVPNLHLEHIRKTFVPIPPYKEQDNIIKLIKKYFSALTLIEKSLN